LRAEDELPIGQERVIKRLDAEPVAGEEERLAVAVPQRKSEHAAEALHAVLAPLLPGVNDDLGVAPGTKYVTRAHELGDQLLVVVDLAVEDDDDAAVLVEKRLLPGRKVDDRQAPVPEAQSRLEMQAAFVGPAVKLRLAHARDEIARDRSRSAQVHHADDAAHAGPRAQEGAGGAGSGSTLTDGTATPAAASSRSYRLT